MPLIFNNFDRFSSPSGLGRSAALCALLVGTAALTPLFAQSDDDLYGIPGSSAPAMADTTEAEVAGTPAPAAPDTTVPQVEPDSVAVSPISPPAVAPTPRPRITRETTINPLDQQKGAYRNPKKALFMSLMVPGLGQAYVGQSAFTYARAALYFSTEITLGLMWYHYSVVKYDRKTTQYRRFADEHWSQGAYEQRSFDESAAETFDFVNPNRSSYCGAVVDRETPTGNGLYLSCMNVLRPDSAVLAGYQGFKGQFDDRALFAPPLGTGTSNPDSVGTWRARNISDPVEFYRVIGQYQEFISGWDNAVGVVYSADSISGTSSSRDEYNRMRKQAQDYSRMQAWFIGGIVINHIASAVDAALTARHNNRVLYEGEARWYDRVNLDGGLAFTGGRPMTHMTARLSF